MRGCVRWCVGACMCVCECMKHTEMSVYNTFDHIIGNLHIYVMLLDVHMVKLILHAMF